MPKKSGKTVLNIALSGAGGRMAQELQQIAGSDPGWAVVAQVKCAADWKKVKAARIDIAIDFSSPGGLSAAVDWCVAEKKPLVSGTTGLSGKDQTKLGQASKNIGLLYSANMSLGIAVLSSMLRSFQALPDWDFQIEEAHHSQKKDKPSGTALLLQDRLGQVIQRELPPPNVVRGGAIPGIHQIWAMGPDEALILQHTAFHRRVFARGALQAARWLFDKKQPGLYDLSDLYKMT